MFKIKWESILIFLALVLCYLSLLTPFALITIFLLIAPIIILFVRSSIVMFFVLYGLANLILFIIFGTPGLMLVLFSMFLMIPSLAMGIAFKKSLPASRVISRGTISLIAITLAVLVIIYQNGFDIFEDFKHYLTNYFDTLPDQLKVIVTNNQREVFVDLFMVLIPFYIIGFSLLYVYINYIVSRVILNRLGERTEGLLAFHKWRLPKLIVFLYFITLGVNFFFIKEYDSYWSMIFVNLLPLLSIAIIIQAYSFIFFMIDIKKRSKWLAYSSIILLLLTPFTIIIIILGLLDILIPIRERVIKK